MASKNKRDAEWVRAKRLCRLNGETVRMAKELRLNPRKLVKSIPSKSQPWKAPLHVWIRDLYEKMQEKAARTQTRKLAAQANRSETQNSVEATKVAPAGPPAQPACEENAADNIRF